MDDGCFEDPGWVEGWDVAFAELYLHALDDLYDGWDGLPRVGAQLDALLTPLAAGRPGHYRRYDWHASAYAETVTVPPCDLLVVEGVGCGSARHAGLGGPGREAVGWDRCVFVSGTGPRDGVCAAPVRRQLKGGAFWTSGVPPPPTEAGPLLSMICSFG